MAVLSLQHLADIGVFHPPEVAPAPAPAGASSGSSKQASAQQFSEKVASPEPVAEVSGRNALNSVTPGAPGAAGAAPTTEMLYMKDLTWTERFSYDEARLLEVGILFAWWR